jgi:lipoprotein-releasing system ATP-binding protein
MSNSTSSISSEVGQQPRDHAIQGPHFKLTPGKQNAAAKSAATILGCEALRKSYRKGSIEIPVLRGADLRVAAGEFKAIVGQSGSGKSTLLHLLATLDRPDGGEIRFEGNRIDNLPAKGRDILRNRYFGMVFQFYHLLPELTTEENVLLPSMIAHSFWRYLGAKAKLRRRAHELIGLVGLDHRRKHRPRELSGGEMQRVAIARALMSEPRILLADEPTGNLDSQTGDEIMKILRNLNRQHGLTIVMVTHDQLIAEQADGTLRMTEGRIETTTPARRAS